MTDYDFSTLNDKEFEILSTDILSSLLGKHVERFKAGRDGGVDGRFFTADGAESIIQCKHWLKSGVSKLIHYLKSTEAIKVKRLNPKRYIFVTSLELSKPDKSKIKLIFSPYILIESDIYGKEDLNDILSKRPEIEKRHYKLWLTSSNVMKTLLDTAIIGRSKHKLDEIVSESQRYVPTSGHHEALAKIEKIRSVIITGSPGIGKTTLADQLCLFYVASGYEFCFIENSLNEAESIYREEAKQVFYFDDFLGSNFLLSLDPHKDSHTVNFMRRIERDSKKRFILTSRTNIMNQGKLLSELFQMKRIEANEYLISIDSLSAIDKAKILYNHIWFGNLNEIYINEIYKNQRYLLIVEHDNFNPRLISFITDSSRLTSISPENYWRHIYSTLSNPKDIWRHVFEVQLDDISKHICAAISLNGNEISDNSIRQLYDNLTKSRICGRGAKSFDSVIRLLVGALLNRHLFGKDLLFYSLFNPSIADFVLANYLTDLTYIDELMFSLKTKKSIDFVRSLFISKRIDESYYTKLIMSQVSRLVNEKPVVSDHTLNLLIEASEAFSLDVNVSNFVESLTYDALKLKPKTFGLNYYRFILLALNIGKLTKNRTELLICAGSWITHDLNGYDEYICMSKIIAIIEPVPSTLTESFKERCIEFLSDNITSEVIDQNLQIEIYEEDQYDKHVVFEHIKETLSMLGVSYDAVDIEGIEACCDVDDIIQSNIDTSIEGHSEFENHLGEQRLSCNEQLAILDLFDKG